MSIVAECRECGSTQKFADADEGAVARCRQCGANLPVARKSSRFEPSAKPAKKKKKRREPKPNARLTDDDRRGIVRAGERGARFMLTALLLNFAAFILYWLPLFTLMRASAQTIGLPSFTLPALGLSSSACLMAAMLVWRRAAAVSDLKTVVHVGMALGPALFAVDLVSAFGVKAELLTWLATYGRMVYFTLLVVVLERICVLADRADLIDLTHRVLSCGVGVIGCAVLQQCIVWMGLALLMPVVAMLSVAMVILWAVWCVEYFRLLTFAVRLRQ
jgi:DNA-directed RNA polymerase subunit M/transcription elongation factor TFIIS